LQRLKISIQDAGLAGLNQMLDRAVMYSASRQDCNSPAFDIDQAEADLESGSRPLIVILRIHA
jgi:hypothetical protein